MKSVKYFLLEYRYVRVALTFIAISFALVAVNLWWPKLGISDFTKLLETGLLVGVMVGLLTSVFRGKELTMWQRLQVRLLSFAYHFLVTFIGGGLGLLFLK